MSSDPSSKSAAKNGRRFDLRHMKFSVFNTDWVTNERESISSRSHDHFKKKVNYVTERSVLIHELSEELYPIRACARILQFPFFLCRVFLF